MSPLQTIEPEIQSLDSFLKGVMYDPEDAEVPLDALLDSNNLLPDRSTGAIKTRKGFRRFGTFNEAGYKVKALHPFNAIYGTLDQGKQYLMALATTGTSAVANNMKLYAINLTTGTATRVDEPSRAWRYALGLHFGIVVDNVFYGGGESDPIYSYRPYYMNGVATSSGIAWDPDATMPQRAPANWTLTTAYVAHDRVENGGYVWACMLAHTATADKEPASGFNSADYWQRMAPRYNDWATATAYAIGDTVMKNVSADPKYPRGQAGRTVNTYSAFICKRGHTSDGTNTPPSWAWEPSRAPVSSVGIYHGSRMFMRDSDTGTSRVRYSNQVKGDGLFDQTDWTSSTVTDAGFFDVRTGDGDDVRWFAELGNDLLIFKRHSTWVLTGLSPSTWSLRKISDVGCVGKRASAELEGLLYFMSDQGLMCTDGSIVQECPGFENIRHWVKDQLEYAYNAVTNMPHLRMAVYDRYIWLTLPQEVGTPVTLVYDPQNQAFWPQNFSTHQFAVNAVDKVDQLFFASQSDPALVLQYDHTSAGDQDDTRVASYAGTAITWFARLGWLNFGTANEDRKLRRSWARVRAVSKTITLKCYKNFVESVVWTVATALPAGPINTVEGQKIDEAQAVSFRVEGTSAPTSLLGVATHTEFRRKRFHRA